MKTILKTILLILLLATSAYADGNTVSTLGTIQDSFNMFITPDADGIYTMTTSTMSDHIKEHAKRGEICEVYGHKWAMSAMINTIYCSEGCPQTRYCIICGKRQVSRSGWEDIK